MSTLLELLFGRPVTLEQRYDATIDETKKAVRLARRQEEARLDDASELGVEAKNAARAGDFERARALLAKAAGKRREARRFGGLCREAERLMSLAQQQGIQQRLLAVQGRLSQLARAAAPPVPLAAAQQAAAARGANVARFEQHFELATDAFRVGLDAHAADSDDDEDTLDGEAADTIDSTIDLWRAEFDPLQQLDRPVAARTRARPTSSQQQTGGGDDNPW